MEKILVRPRFIAWVQTKAQEKISSLHPFLLACLDEQIEQSLNSTYNDTPFYEYYPEEELMIQILDGWYSTAKSFLQLPDTGVSFTFRQVPLPSGDGRKQLLSTLTALVLKCVDPGEKKNMGTE